MKTAIIEMPKGTRNKLEIKDGVLTLDRLISVPVPFSYGFLENTLSGDGDPTDIFVITEEAIPPTTKVNVIPQYLLHCIDNGEEDNKYVGHVSGDFITEQDYEQSIDKILDYLLSYKSGFKVNKITKV